VCGLLELGLQVSRASDSSQSVWQTPGLGKESLTARGWGLVKGKRMAGIYGYCRFNGLFRGAEIVVGRNVTTRVRDISWASGDSGFRGF
jgi:hypothetical protein